MCLRARHRKQPIFHTTPTVRSVTALVLGALALAALFVGLVVGPVTGGALLVLGLLVLIVHHLRNLERLQGWVELDRDEMVPGGTGVWTPVLSGLERRMRVLRERQDELIASLERFRTASQAMPDGVMYLSSHDVIEWINKRAEQHFGLDNERDHGCLLAGLVRQPELLHYLDEPLPDEPLVISSPRRPGVRLLVQLVPFGSDQRMLVSRDITQIERLETMRRDFIANVSHELQTPLTVVGGFVETLMDGLDDLPRADILRFLQLALEQSGRMQRLIHDLLALSALETGAPAPNEEEVDVHALVREVYQETQALSGGRHQIRVSGLDSDDVLLGSHKELYSAFANLTSNAVRYTPQGGRISLSWRQTGQGGEFTVEDNGIGIDARHIVRLTERFFRVDRSRSRETGGTGLGLAIVKHVVSRHQAELHIDSEPGKGSRFCVQFPPSRIRRQAALPTPRS